MYTCLEERLDAAFRRADKLRTPWGVVQTKEYITPWMFVVTTAGHGGVKIDRAHNALIPSDYRRSGGWYEEDCEVAIPIYFLFEKIATDKCGARWFTPSKESAKESLDRYFPSGL